MIDLSAYFDNWAHDALDDYPIIYEGNQERVYIRADEARRLLEQAYQAGYELYQERRPYQYALGVR